jgi:DNA adenine methylase
MAATALKWHGGKGMIAGRILREFPARKSVSSPNGWIHYVEPFFGGGSLLFTQEPHGISEVVNDIHKDLSNFWKVLQAGDSFGKFQRLAQATPFSEVEWSDARLELDEWPEPCEEASDSVVRAWRFFICCRQSLAGRMKSFTPLSKSRTRVAMNEQASAWLTAVEGLPAVHERLKRVVILNRDAVDVIRQQDGEDTLFYCDPPYLQETRAAPEVYRHEMDEAGHRRLLAALKQTKGKVVLSGYPSPLYDGELAGWRVVDIDAANHSAGGASKRRMVERLWVKGGEA